MLATKVVPIRRGRHIRNERMKRTTERRTKQAESAMMATVGAPTKRTVLLAGIVGGLVAGAIIAGALVAIQSVHFAEAMSGGLSL